MADLTNPSGSPNPNNPIEPTLAIGWSSTNNGTISAVKLKAATVVTTTYNKTILVGSEKSSGSPRIHVTEINPTTGALSEPVAVRGRGRHPRPARRRGRQQRDLHLLRRECGRPPGVSVHSRNRHRPGRRNPGHLHPGRGARSPAFPGDLRSPVGGERLDLLHRHLRHAVADPGRHAAARAVSAAQRRLRCHVPGHRIRGPGPAERRQPDGLSSTGRSCRRRRTRSRRPSSTSPASRPIRTRRRLRSRR